MLYKVNTTVTRLPDPPNTNLVHWCSVVSFNSLSLCYCTFPWPINTFTLRWIIMCLSFHVLWNYTSAKAPLKSNSFNADIFLSSLTFACKAWHYSSTVACIMYYNYLWQLKPFNLLHCYLWLHINPMSEKALFK